MVVAGRAIAPRELRQVRKEATVSGQLNVLINLAAATMKIKPTRYLVGFSFTNLVSSS